MDVRLLYFEGCPNWPTTYERLGAVLEELGHADAEVVLVRVDSPERAEPLQFVGSPTILVNGADAFPTSNPVFGLSCRVFETPDGPAGSPTTDQLRRVLSGTA
jgi:hypothetical protein